ncbi:MAG: hypothetical protein ABJH98_12960 [Reichenbachiella sp.]|uniref:hypothetical protein n=1 Tax=Reichenbachiella sp. TaxID=2184521 RepID=UPI003297F602
MSRNRKKVIALLSAFLMIGTTHAQSFSEIALLENRVEKATLFMKMKYDLNEEQYYSVLEVNKDIAQKVKPILLSDKTKMEKILAIKPLGIERGKALMRIFNEEQKKTFRTIKEERKALLQTWLED